tara:strand:+ start:51 stop:728 length:678 start_codon:yes stop_codon:yes gene_type:complete
MLFIILIFFSLFIFPVIWLNYILNKNNKTLINMPFNGLEFGNQILEENKLYNVKIEKTLIGDHYDLKERKVRVLEERISKKSLTAISIICHEIGHALQHKESYQPLVRRTSIVKKTSWILNIGNIVLYSALPIVLSTGSMVFLKLCFTVAAISLLISVIIQILTLDVEFDASFNRAYPIIKKKVPIQYHKACKSILTAAALTYVIGVIRNFISIRFLWMILSKLR